MYKLHKILIYLYPTDNGDSKLNMQLIRYNDINIIKKVKFIFRNLLEQRKKMKIWKITSNERNISINTIDYVDDVLIELKEYLAVSLRRYSHCDQHQKQHFPTLGGLVLKNE